MKTFTNIDEMYWRLESDIRDMKKLRAHLKQAAFLADLLTGGNHAEYFSGLYNALSSRPEEIKEIQDEAEQLMQKLEGLNQDDHVA